MLANVSQLLVDDGIFVYDESDRVYTICHLVGYRDARSEVVEKDKVVLTIQRIKILDQSM